MELIKLQFSKLMRHIRAQQKMDLLLYICGIVLALALRFTMFSYWSGDYYVFVEPWHKILEEKGFMAFGENFSNYTPPYLYLLYFSTIFFSWLEDITAVKLLAVIYDFICAYYVYKIVGLKYQRGPAPFFAFFTVLFTPTVVLNGSLWGQADIFYTAPLVASLYYLLVGRERTAFIALSIAFAFKLQALFLFPLFLALLIKRLVNWTNFFYLPFVYLLAVLPAWVAGRPLLDLFTIYIQQGSTYHFLTMNASNMYTWIPNSFYDLLHISGYVLTVSVIFLLVALVYKSPGAVTRSLMVQLASFSVLIVPYFLPKMHDRYFFAADVFSIIFAFYFPKYWWASLTIVLASFFTYFIFLFSKSVFPAEYLALGLLIVIVLLARHLVSNLFWARNL